MVAAIAAALALAPACVSAHADEPPAVECREQTAQPFLIRANMKSDALQCRRPADSPFDRADLPECWVRVFERFGFYWLGWDEMQDTMHFEFLGQPH